MKETEDHGEQKSFCVFVHWAAILVAALAGDCYWVFMRRLDMQNTLNFLVVDKDIFSIQFILAMIEVLIITVTILLFKPSDFPAAPFLLINGVTAVMLVHICTHLFFPTELKRLILSCIFLGFFWTLALLRDTKSHT